jgi:hypothetical protein
MRHSKDLQKVERLPLLSRCNFFPSFVLLDAKLGRSVEDKISESSAPGANLCHATPRHAFTLHSLNSLNPIGMERAAAGPLLIRIGERMRSPFLHSSSSSSSLERSCSNSSKDSARGEASKEEDRSSVLFSGRGGGASHLITLCVALQKESNVCTQTETPGVGLGIKCAAQKAKQEQLVGSDVWVAMCG